MLALGGVTFRGHNERELGACPSDGKIRPHSKSTIQHRELAAMPQAHASWAVASFQSCILRRPLLIEGNTVCCLWLPGVGINLCECLRWPLVASLLTGQVQNGDRKNYGEARGSGSDR
jgi:hypothetical protein